MLMSFIYHMQSAKNHFDSGDTDSARREFNHAYSELASVVREVSDIEAEALDAIVAHCDMNDAEQNRVPT